MSASSRRRFIAAIAGAMVVSGCGGATPAPTATQSASSPTQAPSQAAVAPTPTAKSVPATTAPTTAAAEATATPTAAEAAPTVPAAIASLAAGEGAIVAIGGQPVAAYKDAQGGVTMLSPKCPHMGCEVAWNASDKTWDCPCHGSRFNADGSLKNGPASKGLTAIS